MTSVRLREDAQVDLRGCSSEMGEQGRQDHGRDIIRRGDAEGAQRIGRNECAGANGDVDASEPVPDVRRQLQGTRRRLHAGCA
jgi:hypothetical protein